jgi:hypothetical protein
MKIILTETQYKNILLENYKDEINNKIVKMYDFSKKVIKDAMHQFNDDFKFLLTYGAGIGAIMIPVNEYLQDNFSGLNNIQIAGISVMAISVVFFENKNLKNSLGKINSMNLSDELDSAISFTKKLKDKFIYLLRLLGVSIHRISNIISYSFLIPILGILISIVTKHGVNSEQFLIFVESLLTSGVIAIKGVAIRDILFKAGEMIEEKNTNQS